MTVWPHFSFSQRMTWPPSAAVRQRSIADILELAEADMTGIGLTPCRSLVAEDIRNLQRRAGHRCGRLRWRRVFIVLSGAFAGLLPWLPARL